MAEPIDLPLGLWTRGQKDAQVKLYSPGGAIVPTWESTLAPPDEYNWTVRLRQWCGLVSNYLDHFLLLLLL